MAVRLTVVTGPMFSGKSEEVIRRLNRARYAHEAGATKRVLAFKPAIDTLYGSAIATKKIVDGESVITDTWPAIYVDSEEDADAAMETAGEIEVLAIDEGQFFDDWLFRFVRKLLKTHADHDLEIIISGLDLDAECRPFGPMPELLALADNVIKLTAICFRCGRKAGLTKRIDSTSRAQVQIGDSKIYQARCRPCYKLP